MGSKATGTIVTLLDLTDRDAQENDIFPLQTETTWFTRDQDRKTIEFTPQVQTIPFRGPAEFGQHFLFEIGSILTGDVLFGAALQLELSHWLDDATRLQLEAGTIRYTDPTQAWEYANSLGTACIQSAELEIDGKTIEKIDGDFTNVVSLLFADYNTQVGGGYDHLGRVPIAMLREVATQATPRYIAGPRSYPTEDGFINCPLPFFFSRVKYQEALSMAAIKDGLARIRVVLRPFSEIVRQVRGFRDTCTSVPLGIPVSFTNVATGAVTTVTTNPVEPRMKSVSLLTHGAILNGEIRQRMIYSPFETLHREVQTFSFDEPAKYVVSKQSDTVLVQLPLEANHPVEEILWFVRRKGTGINNEWTNYSDTLEQEWSLASSALVKPLLVSAGLQVNGIQYVQAEEQYFRQHIAGKHSGGYVAYSNFVYGISFAETPGKHQPSGSINASRANSIRLNLEVRPPGGVLDASWEIKVYCIGMNWLRFQNGLANPVFED